MLFEPFTARKLLLANRTVMAPMTLSLIHISEPTRPY